MVDATTLETARSSAAPWHLGALEIPALRQRSLTGKGVTIAVVDTGVVADHQGLRGRRLRALDTRGPAFDGIDHHGHGTSMIGLLIGEQGPIAPDATVVSVKALMSGPAGSSQALVLGISLALKQEIDVLSLSVGTSAV